MDRIEPGKMERWGGTVEYARRWGTMAWRLGVLMTKGAFLVKERRRLIAKLGELSYARLKSGELKDSELEKLAHQVDRIAKKIEIEEMLVRSVRFGGRARHSGRAADSAAPSGGTNV